MFIRPREPYTFSPLHGFRVPGFTFWQGRVSSWVSGFGFRNKCGLQVGFRVSESAGTSCVVSGRPTIRDVPSLISLQLLQNKNILLSLLPLLSLL
jgi:hypothetical protein